MSGPNVGLTRRPSGAADSAGQLSGMQLAVLLYGLTAGVIWWAAHLVALASVSPAVCDGSPSWVLSVINGVCVLGVGTALWASVRSTRTADAPEAAGRGAWFLARVAILFNLASLVLVVLESVPVYVLEPC